MTTNGSVIYMIPIALNDRKNNGTRVVANKRGYNFQTFTIVRTAASAFRYKNTFSIILVVSIIIC